MSWNVEQFDIQQYKTHPESKVKMLELINQFKPDVACFQEMVGGDYNKAINYLGDFKRALHFENYYYSYDLRLDFDHMHHFGVIIFSRSPFIKKKTVSFAPSGNVSTGGSFIDGPGNAKVLSAVTLCVGTARGFTKVRSGSHPT